MYPDDCMEKELLKEAKDEAKQKLAMERLTSNGTAETSLRELEKNIV